MVTHVLDDIVLDKWAGRPAIYREVTVAIWAVLSAIADGSRYGK